MFGQEPRLPVDFLLGRVQDVEVGSVHEWVREHQARLQVAFEGARARLEAAAGRRKVSHDAHVRDAPLGEGQLVYLREYGMRGRHKIQDLWSPVVYQVVKAPKEGGTVYTIAPVDDLGKTRVVHRSAVKAQIQRGGPSLASIPPPAVEDEVPPAEVSSEDVDLLMLVPATSQVSQGPVPQVLVSLDASTPQSMLVGSDGETPVGRGHEVPDFVSGVVPGPTSLSEDQSGRAGVPLRRTGRTTAGYHSNLHRLPRAVEGGTRAATVQGPISNGISIWFRPWDAGQN
ncbi:hypothetical protein ABG768_020195 [Culter alburnus]|uniref:Uncharacterized protein n=1 Tax=Culter alburnus TaxID=194366 RepID=A0AAW2AXI0_CULAL